VTICGEMLFLENFLAGYGILKLTGILCGRKPSGVRVAAGAVMCGLFGFVVVVGLSRPAAFGLEVVFAACLMGFVFRPGGKAAAGRLTAVFLIVSFMLGGAVIAFIYAAGIKGIVSNGVLYIGSYGYLIVLGAAAAGLAIMSAAAGYMRKMAPKSEERFRVTVELSGRKMICTGKVDTGNSLREPLSGKPVAIIKRAAAEKLLGTESTDELLSRIRSVPFRSVGCDSGIMTAVRCDRMTVYRDDIFGRGKIRLRDAYLGIYDGNFDSDDDQDHDLLLQPEMIEAAKEALTKGNGEKG